MEGVGWVGRGDADVSFFFLVVLFVMSSED